ncbi:MAG: hypothetical protein UW26_C0012G0006 [Candidatus Collierbacteria bacterium GW2011_GWF1_44_12]|uniref:Uncharacterized protein n=4 Tax=Candidatus Collieribacteriota TaxID=1752725 RepID=A0A0G1GLQ2_9BACT|nr:MAG: hypothetical protein UW23_C0019G0032 [Candidatus Collierbacteria bacterium GW2011_GWA1_44_12]KKT38791.1 MAG: hypothetical protein UW26_C0012G0006 [Candidatus Collierbacteria bacterium GW2011_GWF1_44_12]KKT99181.1 MAG: hypothetical protein UW99_C0008G0010 [Candidatus Collierbacteria bacterium GW2011_GWC2_45_15]
MSILFYDHLINKEEVIILIESTDEPENHKSRAKQLVDDIIHQEIINFILDKLEEPKHKTFLYLIEERPYDPEIIIFLQEHVSPTIDRELQEFASSLIEEIKRDFLSEE